MASIEPASNPGTTSNPQRDAEATIFRAVLCWIGFFVPVSFEIYIHVGHGFGRDAILGEDEIMPKELSCFTDFSELICRVCLAQVMVAMLVFFLRALSHRQAGQWWQMALGASPRQYMPALISSFITFGVGLWGCIVGDEGLPLWALRYSHICDIFCHAIISSALVGLGFDLLVAIHEERLVKLIKQFVQCDDTIESHGVSGLGNEPEFGEINNHSFGTLQNALASVVVNRRTCRRALQIGIMWACWIFIFIAYTLAWLRPDLAPDWMKVMIDFIGRFCWAGITFWIVTSILSIGVPENSSERNEPDQLTSSILLLPTFDQFEALRGRVESRSKDGPDETLPHPRARPNHS